MPGRSSSAQSAGESVSALIAEIITEIAIVSANCWYMRPVMPGTKATGMNTAESTSAIAMTGPDTSCIALMVASRGEQPVLDVVLDRLDHDDRVVDHEADREHEPEQRERVDREAEHREAA